MMAETTISARDERVALRGAIIDSWLERRETNPRVVLQVTSRALPDRLWIIEAPASMAPDQDWLEDLGENLCHGSLIDAVGHLDRSGIVQASRLRFIR